MRRHGHHHGPGHHHANPHRMGPGRRVMRGPNVGGMIAGAMLGEALIGAEIMGANMMAAGNQMQSAANRQMAVQNQIRAQQLAQQQASLGAQQMAIGQQQAALTQQQMMQQQQRMQQQAATSQHQFMNAALQESATIVTPVVQNLQTHLQNAESGVYDMRSVLALFFTAIERVAARCPQLPVHPVMMMSAQPTCQFEQVLFREFPNGMKTVHNITAVLNEGPMLPPKEVVCMMLVALGRLWRAETYQVSSEVAVCGLPKYEAVYRRENPAGVGCFQNVDHHLMNHCWTPGEMLGFGMLGVERCAKQLETIPAPQPYAPSMPMI